MFDKEQVEYWRFEPQTDITIYELALIMSRVAGGLWQTIPMRPGQEIDEAVKRHFKRCEPTAK